MSDLIPAHLDQLKAQLMARYEARNDEIDRCIRIREQDWPETFPTDPNEAHPWIQIARSFYGMVKPVYSAIADESLARIEAAIGLGLPMPQEHYFRGEGAKDKPKKEAWLRSLQIRLDRQLGISQYARSVYNILMMGRSVRLMHPSDIHLDFYMKGLLDAAETGRIDYEAMAEACKYQPPFINMELDPRTVYCYPNEWEAREAFIVERRAIYDVAHEFGVDFSKDGKGIRKLGPGEYPALEGIRVGEDCEVTTYWNEDIVAHFVSNSSGKTTTECGLLLADPIEHGYGEILQQSGSPSRIPIFIAPGLMRGWGTLREGMPILSEIAGVLSAYDSALTMSLGYSMNQIPQKVIKNANIDRPDAEIADVGPTEDDMAGDLIKIYRGEELSDATTQPPIETLEKQKEQLRQQIDEFFVGYVMRGTPPGSLSNVSGNVVAKMQVAAVAPFLQLSHNIDERDSSIFRFQLACIEHIFGEKVYVWDSEEGRSIGLGPDDIKGDYTVQATSETGLPDSRIIDEEITARRVEQGYELPDKLLSIRGHRDIDTFLERLLEQRAKWLYAVRQTQIMVEQSLQPPQMGGTPGMPPGAPNVAAPQGPAGTEQPMIPGQMLQAGVPGMPILPRGGPGGLPPQGGLPPNAGLQGMPSNAGPGGEVMGQIQRQIQEEGTY